jgi:uncharacterized protein (DUF1501 family)
MTDTPYPPERCSSVTRRRFLAGLGASVAVASAGAYGISVWGRSPNGKGIPAAGPTTTTTTTTTSVPPGTVVVSPDRTLIVIEMGGGNDGLNTVVPHSTGRYHDLRGELAIASPLDLDGEVGFHPTLTFLAERYADGDVAIVEGIGYPDPDLSHFASMANWWSGYPSGVGGTGWLGRYLDGTVGSDDPLAGVTIGPGPTPALLADAAMQISVQDMSGLSPRIPEWIDTRDELVGLWQGFAPAPFDGTTTLDLVRRAIAATADAQASVNGVLGAPAVSSPTSGRARRRSDLEQSIEVAAALATSPVAPRVIYVHGWGDFDTHESQASRHEEMMQQLDLGLRTLFEAIDSAGVGNRVIVMTTSEFGRRPAFNGSGTDHGTAASHIVIGSSIRGGRYGETPSWSDLDRRGNLIHTVDFRSLYASILTGWLKAPATDLLGGEFETLPLWA